MPSWETTPGRLVIFPLFLNLDTMMSKKHVRQIYKLHGFLPKPWFVENTLNAKYYSWRIVRGKLMMFCHSNKEAQGVFPTKTNRLRPHFEISYLTPRIILRMGSLGYLALKKLLWNVWWKKLNCTLYCGVTSAAFILVCFKISWLCSNSSGI
jgi:hypothetical protein